MNRLKQARRAAGMTQQDLAAVLGVRRLTVTRWENGRSKPSVDTLRLLAKALDVKLSDLLDEPAPAEGAA